MSTLNKIVLLLVNICFWAIILFIGFNFTWLSPPFSTAEGTYYLTMLWGNFFNAIVLYANALWLYPHRKRLKIPYWLTVVLLILGTAFVEAIVDYQLVFYLDLVDKLNANLGGIPNWAYVFANGVQNTFIHTGWYILSFTIVFLFESRKNQQIQKALKEEKLKAELQFLRAQINPHFLFNGINSVYFLIDDKPDIAKSTLLKFSDLLRYQLYECQDDAIPLAKEIAHIQAYIDLERIRKGDDVTIQTSLPQTVNTFSISPLLFTPLLENAFKYVSNEDEGSSNRINIALKLEEAQLFFEISNTIDKNTTLTKGGIGLKNVRKRLALLYPKKHQLTISEANNCFIVKLNIILK